MIHETTLYKVATFAFPAIVLKDNFSFCLYPHYEAKFVFFSLLILLCTYIDVVTDVYRF